MEVSQHDRKFFQSVLDKFAGELMFVELLKEIILDNNYFPEDNSNFSDEEAYKLKVNKGIYYIYEKDFFSSWNEVLEGIKAIPDIGNFDFVESAKQESKDFNNYSPVKYAMWAQPPKNLEKLKRFWAEIGGIYFYFLVKPKNQLIDS